MRDVDKGQKFREDVITELVTWRKWKHKEQTRNRTIPTTKPLKYCQTVSPSYSDGNRGLKQDW